MAAKKSAWTASESFVDVAAFIFIVTSFHDSPKSYMFFDKGPMYSRMHVLWEMFDESWLHQEQHDVVSALAVMIS